MLAQVSKPVSKKALLAAACAAFVGAGAQAATLTWTGGGDGTTFGDDANWSGTATGGSIDTAALVDEYVVGAGAAVTNPTRLNFIDNGAGGVGTLTMSGGTVATNGAAGTGLLETPDTFGVMNVTGGTYTTQFLAEMVVTLGGTGEIVLKGAGNPVNITTIDFTSDTSSIHFLAEDVAAATSEHLSKITVNGNAAVVGSNLLIVSDGGNGSIVTAIVPEPGSLALLGLGGLLIARRRRA